MPEFPNVAGRPRAEQASHIGTEEGRGNSHLLRALPY